MTTPRKPFQLTAEQYALLTRALDSNRVGKNPKGFSHMEAWDIRRWLIRIFGFGGFSIETMALDLVKEIEMAPGTIKYANGGANNKTVWTTVYRAQVRLTVWDQFGGSAVFEDGACGDSTNQPAVGDCHDNACKTALSQALKRCAVNMGDQFGLGLYNNGQTNAVVVRSVVAPDRPEVGAADTTVPTDDAPVLPEPSTAPVDEPPAEQAPPVATPETKASPTATSIRDWTLTPDRTASGIRTAAAKLRREHPEVAATRLTNEHGDEEQLSVLMERKAKELTPAAAESAPAPPSDEESAVDRRRKRMFALFNDLGYGGEQQRASRHRIATTVLTRDVASMKDVTAAADVERIISALEDRQRQQKAPVAA